MALSPIHEAGHFAMSRVSRRGRWAVSGAASAAPEALDTPLDCQAGACGGRTLHTTPLFRLGSTRLRQQGRAPARRQPFVNRAAIRSWQRPAPVRILSLSKDAALVKSPTGWNVHQPASDGAGCSQKGILRVPAGSDVMPCKDTNRRSSAP
jgi:hypothetical protein